MRIVLRKILRTVPWVVIMLPPLVASAERRRLAVTLLRTVWRGGSAARDRKVGGCALLER
jgi:hypothetical protein